MKFRTRLAGVLAAGAMSTVFTVAAAPPASAANFFSIQNFGTGKCVQPDPADTTNIGVNLVQSTCNESPAQKWAPNALTGGNFQFVSQSNGGCMEVRTGNFEGAPVDTWFCGPISNETWRPGAAIPNSVPTPVQSKVSNGNRCLVPTSAADGARLVIRTCNLNNPTNLWFIR